MVCGATSASLVKERVEKMSGFRRFRSKICEYQDDFFSSSIKLRGFSLNLTRPLIFVVLLSGCTTIDFKEGPIPGLENMTFEEHLVDASEIYQMCSSCGKLGFELPVACTCVNFRTKHAVIWLGRDAPQSTIDHERAHARGYDHPNGDLRNQYAAWTKRVGSKIAAPAKRAYRAQTDLPKVSALGSKVSQLE